jgi:hypothetical protein
MVLGMMLGLGTVEHPAVSLTLEPCIALGRKEG